MTDRTIFYEVIDLVNPSPEPFAVVRIDTSKRVGKGCEGIVDSLHMDRAVAVEVASRLSEGLSNALN